MTRFRLLLTALGLSLSTGCTGGVNAGKQGGVAFIGLTIMLVLMVGILWFIMGRED